jgi:O-antigen ligase
MSGLAKINRVLEIFWWSMTAATLALVLAMCLIEGWSKWAFYFIIPILTIVMALIRRFAAKKLKKSEEFKAQNQKK